MCSSLGTTSLELSELPGLPESLFALLNWGSSSLFVQISFQCLGLPLLFLGTYDLDVGMFKASSKAPEGS